MNYTPRVIHGAHVVIYSTDSEADRAFFRDVLNYKSVDAGHGRLIFALPPRKSSWTSFSSDGCTATSAARPSTSSAGAQSRG
jgi:hypothetical protein